MRVGGWGVGGWGVGGTGPLGPSPGSTTEQSYSGYVHPDDHTQPTMEVNSVGTFQVTLLKLATPPLPPQTKLNFVQNG